MWCLAYLSDIFQEAGVKSRGPWATSPVQGSVSFFIIKAIFFSVSGILTFKVSTSDGADALDSTYFLRMALNY